MIRRHSESRRPGRSSVVSRLLVIGVALLSALAAACTNDGASSSQGSLPSTTDAEFPGSASTEDMVTSVAFAWVLAVSSGDTARVQPLLPSACVDSAPDAIQSGLTWDPAAMNEIALDVDVKGETATVVLPAAVTRSDSSATLALHRRDDGVWEVHPC